MDRRSALRALGFTSGATVVEASGVTHVFGPMTEPYKFPIIRMQPHFPMVDLEEAMRLVKLAGERRLQSLVLPNGAEFYWSDKPPGAEKVFTPQPPIEMAPKLRTVEYWDGRAWSPIDTGHVKLGHVIRFISPDEPAVHERPFAVISEPLPMTTIPGNYIFDVMRVSDAEIEQVLEESTLRQRSDLVE